MRGFWAIFRLEALALARSKTLAMLFTASAAWTVAAKYLITGDGTAEGFRALYLRYSLGIVFSAVLVCLAAAAAGSISRDRRMKILQLTLVRPVRHFSVALGRIAAMTLSGAAVLAVCAAIAFCIAGRGVQCMHKYKPALEDPVKAAEKLYSQYMADYPDFRERASKLPKRDIMRYLIQHVMNEYETVPPGETHEWRFPGAGDGASAVRIRLTEMFGRFDAPSGVFAYRGRKGSLGVLTGGVATVPLDEAAPGSGTENGPSELSFENTGRTGLSLHPRTDLLLLSPAGSQAWNFVRAVIVMACVLAAFVSLGMLLGACLSRSVAVFCVLSLLFVMAVSPSVTESYPDPLEGSKVDRMSLALTDFAASMSAPLNAFDPVSRLEETFCVEWSDVGKAAALNMLLLPFAFSFLAGFVMSRKSTVSL